MHRLIAATAALSLAVACGGPCDHCKEDAALWEACHEEWADEYHIELNCLQHISADWYDGDGQLTEAGLEAWTDAMVPCESYAMVLDSCRDQVRAKEQAYDDVSEYHAICEDGEDSEAAQARRDLDCGGWLEALGIL